MASDSISIKLENTHHRGKYTVHTYGWSPVFQVRIQLIHYIQQITTYFLCWSVPVFLKLETSHKAILPPTVIVLWSNDGSSIVRAKGRILSGTSFGHNWQHRQLQTDELNELHLKCVAITSARLLRSMSEILHRKSRSSHFIVNKFYNIVTLIHDRLDGGGMVDSSKMSVVAVVRKLGKTFGHKYFSFVYFLRQQDAGDQFDTLETILLIMLFL